MFRCIDVQITIRLPYGMNCIYLKLLVRYPRCRSAIILFSICAAIRAGREPGPTTQQQQVVQGRGGGRAEAQNWLKYFKRVRIIYFAL